ncbi:hypothetical protein WOLCODRAFT_94861 [Wolfiporia cocos MD-104 SS10]|uniref:SMP-LTD domain-containing protein n=1 Tax=Wolfiporia cocos (strain MD-104) TaxID=742152 RepID=A0A2H3JDT7_WOLCO|nr:hypothetical protein WOLCODRAFT_94861 [Wolfiporia cocos MD-104 SS10]
MVRGFLDARSKDAKRSRPKDMWYVVLKGKVLYLYEDETMVECEAAIELGGHDVSIYPEGLGDGELFSKRNAIRLKAKVSPPQKEMPSVTKEMKLQGEDVDEKVDELDGSPKQKQKERERLVEAEKRREEAREEALDVSTPWFIFVRSVVEMEDWYHALVHASDNPANAPTLASLEPVFLPVDMSRLVATLDEQPDVIPMRWLNALLGRIFFSYYRTKTLENYIIGRLMKKISKVKRPGFLSHIVVREVSVGNKAPTLSKPMLKELTKEGDAALEVHLHYKGEIRITVEATATINLGARFKTYNVQLVLALVIREIEGNLLVKVKRPPSSRIWYAFTQMPRIALSVEPIVSDRQITWGMILSTIESKVKEVILESVVLPNMDDISFFESLKYQHRGGIWADASRTTPATYESRPEARDETKSTVSASAAELPNPTPNDPEHPPVQRSHSAEEATTETSSEPQEVVMPEMHRAAASLPATPLSPGARRRTWFGNANEAEIEAPGPSASVLGIVTAEENVQRGRKSSETASIATRRSSSTPNQTAADSQDSTPHASEAQQEADDYLSPGHARRSSSQHSSSSRGTSAPHSSDEESSGATADSGVSSWRSKSPVANTNTNSTTRSSAASSTAAFLQTLKSRAGDKQALSNTAKEAMRKWGVNWSGLRKDSGGNGHAAAASSSDDVPDGAPNAHQRSESRSHRPRQSYADVRASVEHRRERERVPPREHATLGGDLRSEPILVPQAAADKGKERTRSTSPSPAHAPGGSPASSYYGSALPAPDQASTASGSPQPRSVSPAPSHALARTDSGKSAKSAKSASAADVVPPPEDETPHSPIHTQPPQARTMTIPGIHASHRGEVMSLGYAPPPPVPERKPGIQSVYRLWKNPGAPQTQPQTQTQTQAGFSGRDEDAPPAAQDAPQSEPQTPTPAVVSPRPVPPPLPPRSGSSFGRGTPQSPPAAASPASAALQSIVSRDLNKRASLTSQGPPPQGSGNEENTPPTSMSPPAGEPPALPTTPRPGARPPALPPRRTPAPAPVS